MMVPSAWHAQASIVQAWDDERYMLRVEGQAPTKWDKWNTDHAIHPAGDTLPERCDVQVDQHNTENYQT